MPVVYQGLPGTSQGDLFQGLKLWVAQRVPQRARWLDLIKGNGGEVVRLEKTADMLIADNVRVAGVSPPPGSYMWKWIDDSIKNGFLQYKDDYLIGRREGSAREPGAAEQAKVGRTAFTSNDDLILTKWVMAEERMGNPPSGAVIYKALERSHPHHTWQSWRDRWVKTLRSRPRPEFSDEEIQAEVDQHRGHSSKAAARPAGPSRRVQPSRAAEPQPLPSDRQNRPATPPGRALKPHPPSSSGRTEGKGRNFFTEEEDQLLLECIEEVRQKNVESGKEVNKNLGGNVIYQDFAKKHPAHSWHSWRDRWVRHLSLIEAVDDAGPDEASSANPEEARHLAKPQLSQPHQYHKALVPATGGTTNQAPRPSTIQQQPNPKSDDQRLKRKQRERRENRAALLIENTWRGHAVRRDMARLEAAVVPLQSLMRGYVARMRTARLAETRKKTDSEPCEADSSQDGEQYQDAEEDLQDADVGLNGMPPEGHDPRQQFYDDLHVILGAIGGKFDSEPAIDGQRIDLWDLYRIARQQDCGLEARNWKLVTEALGFEPVNRFVWEVQACYLKNLAEFEHHITTFENNSDMGEKEVDEQAESLALTSDAVTAPKQPVAQLSPPSYHSSPPIAGSKRSLGQTDLLTSGSGYPSSRPGKRRRVDRTSVIPPTPDEKLGLSDNLLHGVAIQDESSPLRTKAIANGDAIEMSSADDLDELLDDEIGGVDEQDELPSRSAPSRQNFVEPETQDWHLAQDPFPHDDEDDVSPSQQLLLESDAVKSPAKVVLSSQSVVAKKGHRAQPAASNLTGFGGTSTRILRSSPRRAEVPGSLASSSRAPGNGKLKKRTLPASYQRKTSLAATATAATSAPDGRTSSQPRPQPNRSPTARVPSTPPVRATNGSASQPRHINAYTPTSDIRSSTYLSRIVSPPVPAQLTNGKGNSPSREFETHIWDEAFVEAQIRHFQALGYRMDHIVQAMEASSMVRGPLVAALESLSVSGRLPRDEAGVWTPRDSSDLLKIKKYESQVGNGQSIDGWADGKMKVMAWNLEKKHGKSVLETRWNFMEITGKTDGV